jgi:hypothetical protein
MMRRLKPLKKGSSWVGRKSSRTRQTWRNEHTKMVGEKATNLDSKKAERNGR